MLMLFWVGAVVSAYLGYRLHDWWVPAAVACAVVAVNSPCFRCCAAAGGRASSCSGSAS